MNDIYCSVCGAEFNQARIDLNCCPNCKTKFLPNRINDNVTVTLNKSELILLTYWASFWAGHCDNLSSSLDNPNYESLFKPLKPIFAKIKEQTGIESINLFEEVKIVEKEFKTEVKVIMNGKEVIEGED